MSNEARTSVLPISETAENVINLKGVSKTYEGKRGIPFWKVVHRISLWLKKLRIDAHSEWVEKMAAGTGDATIIKDMDFTIPNKKEGEFIVLAGPSGCGKSTVLRFIADLAQPSVGTVLVHDVDVREHSPNLGMVFQDYSSFPWLTVLDNVALGLKYQGISKLEREKKAMEMIKRVGLLGHEMKYAKRPTLSGGQLQRVAIARSLLANPNVLLMDEPFNALDIKTRVQMQDLLCSLFDELHPTIIMVTHDTREAAFLADSIYVMGKAPAKIEHHIVIPEGLRRSRDAQRTQEFNDIVNGLDDTMMKLEN